MGDKLMLIVMILLIIGVDVGTGYYKAWATGTVDSSVMRQGLKYKGAEVLAVVLMACLEAGIEQTGVLNVDLPLLVPTALYIATMELTSIIENLCEVNPVLRRFFEPYLQKLRKSLDEQAPPTDDKEDGDA